MCVKLTQWYSANRSTPCGVTQKKSNIYKLQRIQICAARGITGNFDYINTHSIDLIRALRWVNVQWRWDFLTAVLMYKAIYGLTPMHMTNNIIYSLEKRMIGILGYLIQTMSINHPIIQITQMFIYL